MTNNEDALRCAERSEAEIIRTVELDVFHQNAAAHLRRLVAENEALNHYRKVYGEVSAILACTAEMPPPSDDDEITVQRLKALVQDFEVYVDSCEAKADRIDRLGETIVRLRTENEAKDALLRQAVEALERIDAWLRVRHMGGLMPDEKAIQDAIRQHLEGKA